MVYLEEYYLISRYWGFLRYPIATISNLTHYGHRIYSVKFPSFKIYCDLFYGPAYGLILVTLHVHLKRMYILPLLDLVSYVN